MKVSFKSKLPVRISKKAWHICLFQDAELLTADAFIPEEIKRVGAFIKDSPIRTIDENDQNWILKSIDTSTPKKISSTAGKAFSELPEGCRNLVLHVVLPIELEALERSLEEIFVCLLLSGYRVDKFKEETVADHHLRSLLILTPEGYLELAKVAWSYAGALGEGKRFAMDLVNAPSNHKTPEMIADVVARRAKKTGCRCKVFDKKGIAKLGLSALLAVNQGSTLPPRFLILEYKPKARKSGSLKTIGLVGKGVTFDTGGISLKKNTNMHLLKSDMAGAAAVLGTLDATARLKLSVHLIGIIPLTDNKPDGNAVNPGDVIGSYRGKTIEVIDTDAEGRLILADGLAYLEKNYSTDVMIDVSTLTGAAFLALGAQAGAMFSNNNDLAEELFGAGERSGDKVWRMPLWNEYATAMESSVADIKNYGGPAAGAVTAAKFLQAFIGEHAAWAHLDVAGLMLKSDSRGERIATGYGVSLLLEYCRKAAGI